ncbi:hypothetical protein MTR_7g090765 [Medicago truncatula]|uniref:Uncharacterized protein n=1 Tax=Medicago truncatula TaxID=3880 RepID=A0A072U2E5_MEDTR|nr:hypothetical protein MTR_7g090765 [Medicago truncatula]
MVINPDTKSKDWMKIESETAPAMGGGGAAIRPPCKCPDNTRVFTYPGIPIFIRHEMELALY